MKRINFRTLAIICLVALSAIWFYPKNQTVAFLVKNSSSEYSFQGEVDLEEAESKGPESEILKNVLSMSSIC